MMGVRDDVDGAGGGEKGQTLEPLGVVQEAFLYGRPGPVLDMENAPHRVGRFAGEVGLAVASPTEWHAHTLEEKPPDSGRAFPGDDAHSLRIVQVAAGPLNILGQERRRIALPVGHNAPLGVARIALGEAGFLGEQGHPGPQLGSAYGRG